MRTCLPSFTSASSPFTDRLLVTGKGDLQCFHASASGASSFLNRRWIAALKAAFYLEVNRHHVSAMIIDVSDRSFDLLSRQWQNFRNLGVRASLLKVVQDIKDSDP